ncbi:hypothetical protein OSH11_23125 [Kaistia dalseonensis]|uniref:Uncharacterized protein n=1 Tax=Kaistia dalseonensis TaxID=410840 RepID=A0ABU0HD55_9HYPH|nr:hypothetical protein [Kaistia dalseonensis]MCX5497609.1 hypothetical protein [Kaistia dalseonensis]MDQ0440251.1 hypothetical protein [Kaistia dalseonensis]
MISRRMLLVLVGVVLAILVGLDFTVEHHGAFGIDGTPGFAAWYGFIGAVVAIVLAEGWGRIFRRPEDQRDD